MADTPDKRARILSLVFTDLANSTALKSERGDAAIEALLARHRACVNRLAADCGGRIIDWAGDGCFLTFDTSSSAVLFALRLQMAHADEPDLPGVRVGVHLGEVTESTGDNGVPHIAGLAVDIASRICGLARPGQVLMSAAVYDSARQRIGVESLGKPILWQAHGTYAVKGFDKEIDIGEAGIEGIAPLSTPTSGDKAKLVRRAKRPTARNATLPGGRFRISPGIFVTIGICAIVGFGAAYLSGRTQTNSYRTSDDTGPITSLAVLPLDNLSNDPDQEYFADGMTEAITSELAKIKSIKVVSRTSATRFKDTQLPIGQVADQLGVEGVIEGSVQRDGNDVKITVQLIHGPSDTHVWSESYDAEMTNVLKLESEIALAIASALKAELTGDERQRIDRSRSVVPEAHDAYLLGIHFLDEITGDGLRSSVRYFEQATSVDPDFAEAWARLAYSYLYLTGFGFAVPGETFEKARAAALRAVDIDPGSELGRVVLARIAWSYDREWSKADGLFRELLVSYPNSAIVQNGYALYLTAIGHRAEAIRHASTALRLDPDDPWTVRNSQMVFLYCGVPGLGLAELERVAQARPDFLPADVILIGTYAAMGDLDKSLAKAERWVERSDGSEAAIVALGDTFARMGNLDRARSLLEAAAGRTGESFASRMAISHAVVGDMDRAFEWMEGSVQSRDFGTFWFRTMPYRLDSLNDPNMIRFRTDDRFHELVDQMGYPPLPPDHPGYAEEQAWLARKRSATDPNLPITKIAVLPLDNLSNDPEQEYFSDGMTEAITSELSKIKSLKVVSRTSVERYKGTTKSMPEIADELGVQGLIEGSVQRYGDDVRITVQLIHGLADTHLWSESYTNTVTNVLKLQSDVALAIADAMKAELTGDERTRIAKSRQVKPEAYELYVQAMGYRDQGSPDRIEQSLGLLEKATQIDPEFPEAWAEMGYLYGSRPRGGQGFEEARSRAREASLKALELDGDLPMAHLALGFVAMFVDWEWEQAERSLRRAVELDPNFVRGRLAYSFFFNSVGRMPEAMEQLLMIANPEMQDSWTIRNLEGGRGIAGDADTAIRNLERLLASPAGFVRAEGPLIDAYLRAGDTAKAVATAEKMVQLTGGDAFSTSLAGLAYAAAGQIESARAAAAAVSTRADLGDPFETRSIVLTHVLLGNLEEAFQWLNTGYESREPGLHRMRIFPFLPPFLDNPNMIRFRGDPRYWETMEKMHFPPFPPEFAGYAEEQAWLARKGAGQTTP